MTTKDEVLALADAEEIPHELACIRSAFEAGRPTSPGGYEQKFRGKWYEAQPIDRTPRCDCGRDEIVRVIRRMARLHAARLAVVEAAKAWVAAEAGEPAIGAALDVDDAVTALIAQEENK